MINRIKSFFAKINKYKYYVIVFVVSFFVSFMLFFPGQRVAVYVIEHISSQTGMLITSSGEDILFIPSLGIFTEKAVVKTSPMMPEFNLENSFVGVPVLSLLVFSPSLKMKTNIMGGELNLKAYGIPLSASKKVTELIIDLEAQKLSLSKFLQAFFPLLDIDADAKLKIDGMVNMGNSNYSDLNLNLELERIKIKESNLFGFLIPETNIKSGLMNGAISNGEFIIEKLQLGGPGQDVELSARGKMSLLASKPYDFSINIKLAGNVDKSFSSFLSMLPPQSKKPDGTYSFRVRGDARSPIPQFLAL